MRAKSSRRHAAPGGRGSVKAMRLRGGWLGGLAVAACSLDTGGVASSGANTLGPGPGGSSTTDSMTESDPHADSTHGDSDATSGSADTTGPAIGTGDETQLSISDGPIYDFGVVPVSMLRTKILTVTNIGDTDATGITPIDLIPPFEYTGMAYPGAGGTCTDVLGPGQSCTLDLAFRPQQIGLHADTLILAYDQGPDSTREIAGGGRDRATICWSTPGGKPGQSTSGLAQHCTGGMVSRSSIHRGHRPRRLLLSLCRTGTRLQ